MPGDPLGDTFTAFGLVLLLELGDKTQLAVLGLSARTGRIFAVFIGASLALISVTAIGVGAGYLVGEALPLEWVSRAAGVVFIATAAYIFWSVWKDRGAEKDAEGGAASGMRSLSAVRTLGITFGALFLAEMGDKTQVAVVGLTVRTGEPLAVFIGGAVALTLLTLIGALAGKTIARLLPERWVSLGAGTVLLTIGVLALAGLL